MKLKIGMKIVINDNCSNKYFVGKTGIIRKMSNDESRVYVALDNDSVLTNRMFYNTSVSPRYQWEDL